MSTTRTPISLLERLRTRGDAESWECFVELYAPLIYGWLRSFRLQHADACDLGQEVLITVSREMPEFRYDPARGSFRAWLRGVVTNRLRGFWRNQRNLPATLDSEWQRQLAELEDPASQISARLDAEHDSHVRRRVLAIIRSDFDTTTWQAFWQVVVEDKKPAGVATELGLSPNAVRLAKARVLKRLREEIRGLVD